LRIIASFNLRAKVRNVPIIGGSSSLKIKKEIIGPQNAKIAVYAKDVSARPGAKVLRCGMHHDGSIRFVARGRTPEFFQRAGFERGVSDRSRRCAPDPGVERAGGLFTGNHGSDGWQDLGSPDRRGCVAGLSLAELQATLTERMGRFIHNPVVTIHTRQINSKRVYVMGAVKKEGPVLLLRPMTVLQAINEAGGFSEFAKKKKIYVLRTVNGKQTKLPFDYQAVIKGKNLEQNVALMADDTIIVP